MITSNAWLLGLLFGVFTVAIAIALVASANYFSMAHVNYIIGLPITFVLIIAFVVGTIKFLHGIYGIDRYYEDVYFRR